MIPLEWKLNLWLILGFPAAVAWLLLIAIFVRPSTRRGLAWWVLPVVAVTVAAPLVWKFLAWSWKAVQPAVYRVDRTAEWMLDYWWVPLVALAVATLAAAGWLLWRWEHQTTPTSEAPEAPEAPPAPAQMWSLPDAQQWDASDRLPR